MSFTLAHPAAVVFMKNKYLNLSGLILGSMAPDFIYFILFNPSSNLGHTILGAIIVNLPLCFLLNFIYYEYIKDTFIINLPSCISKYYTGLIGIKNKVTNVKEVIIFIYSSIIGMMTHVFWDSFTHKTGYFVLKLNFLRNTIDLLGYKIYAYKIAQHGGTLLGFIIILIFLYKIRNKGLSLNVPIKSKIIYHITALIIEFIVMLFIYIVFNDSFGMGRMVVTFINGLFLGYLSASIIYRHHLKI
ncbi:DUF4184 family protein [Clostridium aestuarii]|uniref:DUF4184 family protein n=1 Tax=Clostridium aestuarii TaxID=338193 RepID=A0ABT4CZM2_9CLOT|nr:DUF4184 family protein [Clostridium aestuarii]MCY6483832.1 DUF4184 family protein [Clostridium aestuarii]